MTEGLGGAEDHPDEHLGDCSTPAHWGYVLGGLVCCGLAGVKMEANESGNSFKEQLLSSG